MNVEVDSIGLADIGATNPRGDTGFSEVVEAQEIFCPA